jgi:O-acetyl-ADP-ribose deacetylase (regulator of RNase III)
MDLPKESDLSKKMDKKNVTIEKGDLLKNNSQYICHQTNTKTTQGKGLSYAMFKAFPWSDVYTDNKNSRTPGTIEVRGDGKKERFVVAMYAQRYPGPPKWANDTVEMREAWFRTCLELIEGLKPTSVAFPKQIGCGLAGGNWEHYVGFIEKGLSCKVTICSLD